MKHTLQHIVPIIFSLFFILHSTVDASSGLGSGVVLTGSDNKASHVPGIYAQPAVTSVNVPAPGKYKLSDRLNFSVNFSAPVYVTGTPALSIIVGSTIKKANYISGTGTSTLVFQYVVGIKDLDTDGITLGAALEGTIKDGTNLDAVMTLNNAGDVSGIKVSGVAPNVTIDPPASTLVNGPFTLHVTFDSPVTGFTAAGMISLNATSYMPQTTDNIHYTVFISPMMNAVVQVWVGINAAKNADLNGNVYPSNTVSITVDLTPPSITSIDIPTAKRYHALDKLSFTAHFSENVKVNLNGEAPYLPINMNGNTVKAYYTGGTGTDALNFEYTIQDGDMAPNGIALNANPIALGGSTITDLAGNNTGLTISSPVDASGIQVSTQHPTVQLFGAIPSLVNKPFTLTALFSEPVTGLTVSSFALTNLQAGALNTTDNTRYTLELTPVADGAAQVSLPADAAMNDFANGNVASGIFSVMADVTPPSVTAIVAPGNGYYNALKAVTFKLQFSEVVNVNLTGQAPYLNIKLDNGTGVANYTQGSGTNELDFVYVVQDGDNALNGVDVESFSPGASIIADPAGNNAVTVLPGGTVMSGVVINTIRPTVTLTTTAPPIVNETFPLTVTFSEPVTGLTQTAFSVANGSVSNLQTNDNITYTADVSPAGDGQVSITLPANMAENIAANGNTASTPLTRSADMTAPAILSVGLPPNGYYNATGLLNFVVNYSEPVFVNTSGGVPYMAVNIDGTAVPATYVSGNGLMSLVFSYAIQNGDMDMDGISLGAGISLGGGGTMRDLAGNDAKLVFSGPIDASGIFINTTHPTVTLSTTAPTYVNNSFTVNIAFSEAMTDLTASDFVVTNANVGVLNTTDQIHYTLEILPTVNGEISISLPADAALNIGRNGNQASNVVKVTADFTPPAPTQVDIPVNGYYNTGKTLNFNIHFGEPVTVNTTGGTPYIAINLDNTVAPATYTSGSGTNTLLFSYTVVDGDMANNGISLGAGISLGGGATITDRAGNQAILVFSAVDASGVKVNTTHPAVTLSTTAINPTNVPFTVTTTFSEAITGLTASDFALTNATVSQLQTTDHITYTILVTPAADGPVSISLPADVAVNIGDNGNQASNTLSILADATAPNITGVAVPVNDYYNAGRLLDFTVQYSEGVIVNNTGGSPTLPIAIGSNTVYASYGGGSGTTSLHFSYTVVAGDQDMDGITVGTGLLLNGATIKDAAGNNALQVLNNVGVTDNVKVNTTHATAVLSTTAPSIVNAPFTITVAFSEAVTGLTQGDFAVTNTSITQLQTTDNITYTALVTPVADGPVTISLPANVAVNLGNNGNTASNTLNIIADATAPVVTQVNVPANGYYKAGQPIIFTVQYSENVIVNTAGGVPSLPLIIGGNIVQAAYMSGSGTSQLTFAYTVAAGDQDMDGISVGASLLLNGGAIKDAATNNALLVLSNMSPTNGVLVNTTHATVVLSTVAPALVKAPFVVTITFSERVTGLGSTSFALVNASAGQPVSTNNISYTLLVTPLADGPVSISLPADAVVNVGNNGNASSNTLNITADITSPVITQVNVPANGYYQAGQVLRFTVLYNENVQVSGGTPSLPLIIGGNTVQATYTGGSGTQQLTFEYTVIAGDQDMDGVALGANLQLNGATIADAATNNALPALNNVASTTGVLVNTTHPSVTLSTLAPGIVNVPFDITATFSEAVTGLSGSDFVLTNATAAQLHTTDNITYTLRVTPTANGMVNISLPADVAVNVGANGNTAANALHITADITAPLITVVSVPTNGYYKANQVLNFVVTYSENVLVNGGIPSLPVVMGGNTVQAVYTGGSGTTQLNFAYTVQNGDQDMDGIALGANMQLNGAVITDAATNNALPALNNVASTVGVRVNTTRPSVTLSTLANGMVNAPFKVTATFSEAVTGLSRSGFSLVNATAAQLQTNDNITYTLLITPAVDGPVSLSLPADVAVNISGNGNTASNTLNMVADATAPVITQVSVPTNGYYHAGQTLSFILHYSENVIVSAGTPSLPVIIGGKVVQATYTGGSGTNQLTFAYTVQNGDQDMDGIALAVNIQLNGATIADAAANNALPALSNAAPMTGVMVNTTHPSVTLSTTATGIVKAPFTITATFSEAVTGLATTDFALTNATAGQLQTTDNITYTLLVTSTADGIVTITLPANIAVNIGNNGNTAANTLSITADVTAPAITGVHVPVNGYYRAGQALTFTVQYSENVTVNNGTPSLPVIIGGNTVQATYTGGSGTTQLTFTYTVQNGDQDMDGIALGANMQLNGAIIADAAGNTALPALNNAAPTTGVMVNTLHPSVVLSTAVTGVVKAPFTIMATFSEAVTGLAATDFALTNATAGQLQTADNITYTLLVTPAADGVITIALPADIAVNIGSNGNMASNVLSLTADATAPMITQVNVPANGYYHAGQLLSFIVQYSEKVTVSNGAPSLPVIIGGNTVQATYTGGSGTTQLTFAYTVQNGDQDMNGIALGANMQLNGAIIADAAGNTALPALNNVASTTGVMVNTTHPSVSLSSATTGTVNASFSITATFSEAVTGLTATDFVLVNATAGQLQTTNNISYILQVIPTADGVVKISLPADIARNIADNGNNAAAETLRVTADMTAPVITIGQTFNVTEHAPAGTMVGTLAAIETMGTLQHWTLTADGAGGAFALDPATGALTVRDMALLSGKTDVTLLLTVSDGLNTSTPGSVGIHIIHVPQGPTNINIDNNTIIEGSPIGTLVGNLTAISTEPGATFTFSLTAGGTNDNSAFQVVGNRLQAAAVLSNSVKSNYTVSIRATDNNRLWVEKTITIQLLPVNQAPTLDAIPDQQLCAINDLQTLQLTGASPVENGQTLSFSVSADQPLFSALTVNAAGLISYRLKDGATGTARITVTVKDNGGTANGGKDNFQRTFNLTVNSLPVVTIASDKTLPVIKGTTLSLTATGGSLYSWANADGIISGQQEAVLQVKPESNTTYQVTVTNAAGCIRTGEINVIVADEIKLSATNILTPNGDGKNDKWVITDLDRYPDNEVTIFDRSGRIVYHRKNYSNDWDGTLNGHPMAQGTYYYVLTVTGNKTMKGFITIIRDN
ncbi:Ig-like domain-containing protein [Chitinophaga eiseniae]|uniref:T9SS type B sorting domain-containing protein n=1 Tax=Chitinophaga eiseniae TaxID=634771 RepID=A0A847SMZ3_9BACT|nr:Ig-like domain-containing protein [Chitinophaga eiseniae]NLR79118.1 T9SS type B sorting domain-containing protein [Chitinophaga eiseniae]